jgi:hypothetical protein
MREEVKETKGKKEELKRIKEGYSVEGENKKDRKTTSTPIPQGYFQK